MDGNIHQESEIPDSCVYFLLIGKVWKVVTVTVTVLQIRDRFFRFDSHLMVSWLGYSETQWLAPRESWSIGFYRKRWKNTDTRDAKQQPLHSCEGIYLIYFQLNHQCWREQKPMNHGHHENRPRFSGLWRMKELKRRQKVKWLSRDQDGIKQNLLGKTSSLAVLEVS